MAGLAEDYREVWAAGAAATRVGGVAGDGVAGTGVGGVRIEPGGVRIEPGDPKISRGENYRGLPWVMLDYPRVFGREDVLAIRTMFLWGHGFNITLHLKGRFQNLYLGVIRERRVALGAAGFFVGVHADEWRHEHTGEVYQDLLGDEGAIGGGGFLKLSAAVGLDRWAEAPGLLAGLFATLVEVLRAGDDV